MKWKVHINVYVWREAAATDRVCLRSSIFPEDSEHCDLKYFYYLESAHPILGKKN